MKAIPFPLPSLVILVCLAALAGFASFAQGRPVKEPIIVPIIIGPVQTIYAGQNGQMKVTMSGTASSNIAVSLSTVNSMATARISLPSTVTVLAGESEATFTATGLSSGNVTVTASANGGSATSSFTVQNPN